MGTTIYDLGRIALGWFFILMIIQGNAQKLRNTIGEQIDDFYFKEFVNQKTDSIKLSDYSGKIVILDFWATWCKACLSTFPKLELLQDEFEDEIAILTINVSDTDERISMFLEKFDMNLPIVLDTDKEIANRFPHRVIPHSIILGTDRKVIAITTPDKIDSNVVNRAIKGESIKLNQKTEDFTFNIQTDNLSPSEAIFQITLSSYNENARGSMMMENDSLRFIILNSSIPGLYMRLLNFTTSRTVFNLDNDTNLDYSDLDRGHKYRPEATSRSEFAYCLEVISKRKINVDVLEGARQILHLNFDLKSKIVKSKRKVKVLKLNDKDFALPISNKTIKPEYGFSGNGFQSYNLPFEGYLTNYLETRLLVPIIDETNLNKNYDIEFIPWYNENPSNIYLELQKLGLELVDAEREIEMLILYEENDMNNGDDGSK